MAESDIQKARRLINEFADNPKQFVNDTKQKQLIDEYQKTIEQMSDKSFEAYHKLMPNDEKKQFATDVSNLIRDTQEENKKVQSQDQKKTLEFNLTFRTSSKLEEALDALKNDPDSKNTQTLIEELPHELKEDPGLRDEFTQLDEHLQGNDMSQEAQLLDHLKNGNAQAAAKLQSESQHQLQKNNLTQAQNTASQTRRNLGSEANYNGAEMRMDAVRGELMIQTGDTTGELNVGLGEGKSFGGDTITDSLHDAKSDMHKQQFEQRIEQQLETTALHADHEADLVQELHEKKEQEQKQEYSATALKPEFKPPGTQ